MTAPVEVGSSPNSDGPMPPKVRACRNRPLDPRYPITQRELELLRLAANGNTNEGIARFLGITKDTVNGTLRSVYRKIGAKDRANAVAIALVRGLIGPHEIAGVQMLPGRMSIHAA
ncbi:helix-turn-helix transcriptional regulator [Streptomyces platensis]|uniref:helix-turn-helix transcriptional regulator n=1 Tax=Streptomyces platensis TaxID=58346 RepID=UPI00331D2451